MQGAEPKKHSKFTVILKGYGGTLHFTGAFQLLICSEVLQISHHHIFKRRYIQRRVFFMSPEILSLAAYIPYTLLPQYVQFQIALQFDYLKPKEPFDDMNTICYLKKEREGSSAEYTISVTFVYSEDEPPETETIYLTELTEIEEHFLNTLIQLRVIQALKHIDD